MRFETYLEDEPILTENMMRNMLQKLKGKAASGAKKVFKNAWDKLSKTLEPVEDDVLQIINKNFGTNFTSFKQISNERVSEEQLDEDWKHWWEMVRMEGFPTLSFYPALTAWIEIGKVLEPDMAVNWKKFGAYAMMWLAIVSYKFVRDFYKWKKEDPETYWAERPEKAKKAGFKVPEKKRARAGFV